MPKQYNSEIEKELHLTRLSIERVEKMLKEQLSDFRNILGCIAAQQMKEAKKKDPSSISKEQYYEMQIKHSPYHISRAKEQLKKDGWEYTKEVKRGKKGST
tara:strand:- start:37 stop:339 length:303 start_codon:yes stop_codon:yes gene_type:complete